jgi:hypothetical protein
VGQPEPDTLLVSFEEHRRRLLGLAYRLLGSAAPRWPVWSSPDPGYSSMGPG